MKINSLINMLFCTALVFPASMLLVGDEILLPANRLEFQEAYQYVMENAMRLKGAEAQIGIREGEQLQARMYPNPNLNMTANELGGSSRWDENELSLGLSQLFLMGGKRKARVRVAEAAGCESRWDMEIMKCDLYTELLHAFINTAAAQERVNIAKDLEKIAERSLDCVMKKSAHGKATAIEAKKSEIALKMSRLSLRKLQAEFNKAKLELAGYWNSIDPHFDDVNYAIYQITPPPPFAELTVELENNPDLSKAHAEIAKAWEMIELEKAQRVPDVAVYVGIATEKFVQDPTLNIGVSIPLPIFDRNQGNIARATHQYNEAIFKELEIKNQLKTKLVVLYQEWVNVYKQAVELQGTVTTMATEVFELSQQSYELGNCEYLEILDTRTTMFNVKQQYLEAVESYHHKKAEMMRLIAKSCSSVFVE